MKDKKEAKQLIAIAISLISVLLLIDLAGAQSYYTFNPNQIYGEEYNTLFPGGIGAYCNTTQNFLVYVDPLEGCQPAVVRSDLLEEQPVNVFCKLKTINLNPLLQSIYIKNVNIKVENKSDIVRGATFHLPYIGEKPLVNAFRQIDGFKSGIAYWDNLGYAVIMLKPEPIERKIPERADVNASIEIRYTASYLFGIEKNTFDLPKLSDAEFRARYNQFSFFNGKGFIRAVDIRPESADVLVYKDSPNDPTPIRVTLPKRKPVPIGFWGFFCDNQNFELELISSELPVTKARLVINNEEFLLGRLEKEAGCEVLSIDEGIFGGGKVRLECGGELVELELLPLSVHLVKDNVEYVYGLGESFIIEEEPKMQEQETEQAQQEKQEQKKARIAYVIYADKRKKEALFAISDVPLQNEIIEEIVKIALDKNGDKASIASEINKLKLKVDIVQASEKGYKVIDVAGVINVPLDQETESYYQEARNKYEELFFKYKDEKDESGEYIGARALYLLAELAGKIGKNADKAQILKKLVDSYSGTDSGLVSKAMAELKSVSYYDGEKATASISTPEGIFVVQLKAIEAPRSDAIYARLKVNGIEGKYSLKSDLGEGWIISQIEERGIKIKKFNYSLGSVTNEIYLAVGEKERLSEKLEIELLETKLERVARVVVRPPALEFVAESNFSIHIGIEKRAIQIGTEKTKEYIKKLNRTIATLQSINDKLTSLIKGWKKACYIGGTALFLKNFLQGLGGKATARRLAMRGFDGKAGWTEWCRQQVSNKAYRSISQCLRENSKEIEKDVNKISSNLKTINSQINAANNACKDKKGQEANECFFKQLKFNKIECGGAQAQEKEKCEKANNFIANISKLANSGLYYKENAKDLLLQLNLIECVDCSDTIKQQAREKLYADANFYLKLAEPTASLAQEHLIFAGSLGKSIELVPQTVQWTTLIGKQEDSLRVNNGGGTIQKGTEYFIADIAGLGLHYFVIGREPGNIPVIKEVYKYEIKKGEATLSTPEACNQIAKELGKNDCLNYLREKLRIVESECGMAIKQQFLRAEFYESGQWRGKLAYMPLNRLEPGLYVYIPDEFKVKSYLENGMLNVFWICDAGANGIPDLALYKQPGDDSCFRIDIEAGWQALGNSIICQEMPQLRLGNIIQQVQSCVADANRQKREGRPVISTSCNGAIKVEKAVNIPSVQCEDFMSSKDCWLLFNLCDPVLCPPSRCDLGGRYPTENVVASGIIGSLVLCLPNFEGGKGTLVPFCLTGINAGLDGLISILKASQDCLNESLASGRTVGICDQIRSIYLCEFMWRELMPFIKIGIPSILERIERKGGGEYALFADTWRRTTDSFNYFVQYYGTTAIEAFKIRSTAEVGSMLCKRFIGLRYPSVASLLEELAKPESPYQFFATVTELPYTEVTAPPQSHYKVYYHIYAGKDQGVYYSVYLKSPTVYPGYYSPEQYIVDTGFIPRGDQKDVSKDFTAQAGYKEICVNINAKEYCGFNVVTQSFAANWLQDKYLESQLMNVTKASECTAGRPSLIPTASILNLQAGITQALEPAIYKQGIVRMCSSKNPGIGVEEASWAPVGYCDSPEIKCWVYMPSISQAIKDVGFVNQTIKSLDEARRLEQAKAIFGKETEFMKAEQIASFAEALDKKIGENDKIISEIEDAISASNEKRVGELTKALSENKKLDELKAFINEKERQLILILDPESLKKIEIKLAQLFGQLTLLKYYEKNAAKLVEKRIEEEREREGKKEGGEKKEEEEIEEGEKGKVKLKPLEEKPPTPKVEKKEVVKLGLPTVREKIKSCSIRKKGARIEFTFNESIEIKALIGGNVTKIATLGKDEVEVKSEVITKMEAESKVILIEYGKLDKANDSIKGEQSIKEGTVIGKSKQLYLTLMEGKVEWSELLTEETWNYIERGCQAFEALLFVGKPGSPYSRQGQTIEYNDTETEICLVFFDPKTQIYYNNKSISIEPHLWSAAKPISTEVLPYSITITWEVILPVLRKPTPILFKNFYKARNMSKGPDSHWIKINNTYYEIIEYKHEEMNKNNNQWCIKPINESSGTFWYRALGTIIINDKEYHFNTGPYFADEKNDWKGLISSVYLKNFLSKSDYYKIEPEQNCGGDICAGLLTIDPSKAMRVSRKSNFSNEHPELCKNNKIGCKLIETAESFYNVPYVFRHPRTICPVNSGHYIASDFIVSDLGLAADCGTLVKSVLEMNNIKKVTEFVRDTWKNLQSMSIANGIYVGDIFEIPHGAAFVYNDSDNNPSTIKPNDELLAMSKEFGTIATKKIKDIKFIVNETTVTISTARNIKKQ
ncbi:MAG: DUF2225 domain-containing protein [Candidatus Pacearchaeota archaeon]